MHFADLSILEFKKYKGTVFALTNAKTVPFVYFDVGDVVDSGDVTLS
jgi:hypothetical protein